MPVSSYFSKCIIFPDTGCLNSSSNAWSISRSPGSQRPYNVSPTIGIPKPCGSLAASLSWWVRPVFGVKIILSGSHPEISREVILPEKINFRELDWVICELFSLKDRGSSAFCFNFERESFFKTDDYLLKKHIKEKIYFNYRFECKLLFEITLKEIIDYDLNYVSLIAFKGEFNPAEDVHVSAFNNMILKGIDFEKFNPKKTKKELKKIQILKNKAFDIKITQIIFVISLLK